MPQKATLMMNGVNRMTLTIVISVQTAEILRDQYIHGTLV